jgi:hypothetical protein
MDGKAGACCYNINAIAAAILYTAFCVAATLNSSMAVFFQ